MKSYDWIVFDSTGTLMTPDPEPAIIYRSAAERFGSTKSVDQLRLGIAEAMGKHFLGDQALLPTSPEFERGRWKRIVGDALDDLTDDNRDAAFELLWRQFEKGSNWRLFDDVLPTIERLRSAGYKIAIASNFDERLKAILTELKLDSYFDDILISSELGWSKPNPRFYDVAAGRLKQTDCSRLLMIGDTHHGDVVVAAESGWHSRFLVRDGSGALEALVSDL